MSTTAERALGVARLDQGSGVRAAHLARLFDDAQRDPRYVVRSQGGVFRARAQDERLAAEFDERGATLRPGDGEDWYARFEATSVRCGAGSRTGRVAPKADAHGANRVAYPRGVAQETWASGQPGFEQTFVVEQDACGKVSTDLDIEVSVDGLMLAARGEGTAVDLRDARGEVLLRYANLYAYDASGRALPAAMHSEGQRIRLRVDVAGAAWPVVVDPVVATLQQKLQLNGTLEDDGAPDDLFGCAVTVNGDTALVGASQDSVGSVVFQGSVHVYVRSGTTWTLETKLVADDGSKDDEFGTSVSLSGDTALVGAPHANPRATAAPGAAYVFVRNGGAWTQQARLSPTDGTPFDAFGASVSLSGDSALVGAPQPDNGASGRTGAAYVFVRSGTKWWQQAQLKAASGVAEDHFGASVSLSGDSALVGAPLRDVGAVVDQGSAYAFVRSGAIWSQQAALVAADGASGDGFGSAVALDGDSALIGAPLRFVSHSVYDNIGAAYVYVRSGSLWASQAELVARDGPERFGYAVSLSSDRAVIGALASYDFTGTAYAYERSGATWSEQARLRSGEIALYGGGDRFGTSVSISGDSLFVGANPVLYNSGLNPESQLIGAAYAYSRSGTTWAQQKLVAGNGTEDGRLGWSLAQSGDTAVVGVPGIYPGGAYFPPELPGSARVYVRSGTRWTLQATLSGDVAEGFGDAVAVSGDTALVCATSMQDPTGPRAIAHVFVRTGTSWTEQAKLVPDTDDLPVPYNCAVALHGDTALLSASSNSAPPGAAIVFVRNGTVWTKQARLTVGNPNSYNQLFGFAVSLEDDVALVGAPDNVYNQLDVGTVYVFVRSGTLWTQQAKLTADDGGEAGVSRDSFGYAVSLHDHRALIGAPDRANGGSAHTYVQAGTTWTREAEFTAGEGASDERFGTAVSLGADKAVVARLREDVYPGNADHGSAYLFALSGGTWTRQTVVSPDDGASGEGFGKSVSLNGSTLMIGAPQVAGQSPFGNPNEGAAYIYLLGSSGEGTAGAPSTDGGADAGRGDGGMPGSGDGSMPNPDAIAPSPDGGRPSGGTQASGGRAGSGGSPGAGGASGGGIDAGEPDSAVPSSNPSATSEGCGCRVARPVTDHRAAMAFALALCLAFARRRLFRRGWA